MVGRQKTQAVFLWFVSLHEQRNELIIDEASRPERKEKKELWFVLWFVSLHEQMNRKWPRGLSEKKRLVSLPHIYAIYVIIFTFYMFIV